MARAGLCDVPTHSGAVRGDQVELWAVDGRSGGGASNGGRGGAGSGDGTRAGPGAGSVGGAAAAVPDNCVTGRDGAALVCVNYEAPDPAELTVVLSDLVGFRPQPPVAAMEPNGWGVVGLETNFISSAAVHEQSGSLLGFPAEVRFIPVGYAWGYGDGETRRSATGGASWAELSLPEFSATSTSHAFQNAGDFTVTPTVAYRAEYRFAGMAWRRIEGTLDSAGTPATAVIRQAGTVVVTGGCGVVRSLPGC